MVACFRQIPIIRGKNTALVPTTLASISRIFLQHPIDYILHAAFSVSCIFPLAEEWSCRGKVLSDRAFYYYLPVIKCEFFFAFSHPRDFRYAMSCLDVYDTLNISNFTLSSIQYFGNSNIWTKTSTPTTTKQKQHATLAPFIPSIGNTIIPKLRKFATNLSLITMRFLCSLVWIISAAVASATSNRTSVRAASRALVDYYFSATTTTGLGRPNRRAVLDNPLKGLLTSPRYTGFNTPDAPIPSTLEFYYIGLSEYVACRLSSLAGRLVCVVG